MSNEFGIFEIRVLSSCRAELSGRVFQGCVRLGSQFVQAYNLEYVSPEIKPIRRLVGSVSLKVLRLQTYNHEVDSLEEGLTGKVFVEGAGIELLSPDVSIMTTEVEPD